MGNGELTYLKTKFLKFVFLKACMQVWAVNMGLGKVVMQTKIMQVGPECK